MSGFSSGWVQYWRGLLRLVPGMHPDAPKRNLLLVVVYAITGSVTVVAVCG